MNKNLSNNHSQRQTDQKHTKKSLKQGKSEFTRSKLERDYEPKIKSFKHKLIKTSEYEKAVFTRIQNQKQEQKVSMGALQCFKKGQVINIDWKTKTNFHKINNGVKFPRINTQPLSLMVQNQISKRTNRTIGFQSQKSLSLKNKSIEDKCLKLRQLLSPTKKESKLFFKIRDTSHLDSKQHISQLLKEVHYDEGEKYKDKSCINQKNVIFSSPIGAMSVNLSELWCKDKEGNNAEIYSQQQQLETETKKNIKIQQQTQKKIQTDNSSKTPLKSVSRASLSTQNQKSKTKQNLKVNKSTIKTQNNLPRRNQSFDILNDPEIYFIIEKSREKIINYKQNEVLKSMSQFERIKFLQDKRNSLPELISNTPHASTSMDDNQNSSKLSKQKVREKIEQQKKLNSLKFSRSIDRLFNQKKYKKTSNYSELNSQFYPNLSTDGQMIEDGFKEKHLKERQNLIKTRKKESLIQVQQKLLKKVKLSLLRQDLTKKFEQIRDKIPRRNILQQ